MRFDSFAPTRAGLAGNPSDGYGGRALAVALAEFQARATLVPTRTVVIESPVGGSRTWPDLSSVCAAEVGASAPHGLAVAAIRRFLTEAPQRGWIDDPPAPAEGFRLRYSSGIPLRVGLAGSSAIVVALLRALTSRYGATIPENDLPGVALAVETEEMGIHGGLMDRVAQVYGGVTWMDLARDLVVNTGRGRIERLAADRLPPLFLAWRPDLAGGSETVHNPLRDRLVRGDHEASRLLGELAALADEARRVLTTGGMEELGPLMDANFELRARLLDVGEGNRQLVETGRRLGAGVKQAGSGGAVVGAFDGDPERTRALADAYGRIGARFRVASVWTALRAGSTADVPADQNPPRVRARNRSGGDA